jgi:hypothetical protein
MSRSLLILLLISLTACAPQPTPTATHEPQPVSTQVPSLQIPAPSDWAGGITRADGTIESVTLHLDETNGRLNIEPKVKT